MNQMPSVNEINHVFNIVREKNISWSPTRKLYDIVLQRAIFQTTIEIITAYNELFWTIPIDQCLDDNG